MIIAERDGATLRTLRAEDRPQVDAPTVLCYSPIQASYIALLGEEC